ncbi:phage tail tip fiber protein [Azospirillum aestuarii]|uniref:phage tail tip fiber protein n=1 Tax=Azospirillum aestuarii TaxID=2802052 RepID=UPI0040552805
MAFVYPDCTSEVTTSTGIAPIIVLEGPEPSFGAFSMRMAVGDETTVRREDGLNFELMRVRLLDRGTDNRFRLEVLDRLDSSNGGAPVNWPAGQQRVFATQLGRFALLPPDAGQAGRPVVVQPDGSYGAGTLDVPVPTGLTLGTLLDAASAGGRSDGAALIRLVVTWDAAPGLDCELEIRDGLTDGWPGTASNGAVVPAGGGRFVANVVGGYTYGVRLRARTVGGVSAWTPEQTIAATGDDVPPGPPTDMVVTEVYGGAVFTFTPPPDADTLEVRFYAAPSDDETAAVLVGAGLRRVALTGLPAGTTRWVWAASADTSGNEGEWIALGPVTALLIEPGDLAAELGERIERLSDVDPASLDLAGEAALEAVLAAHEVRLGAQRRLAQAMTGVDATIDGVRDRLAGVETGLQQEVTTRTDETAALTQSLTTLGAVVEDNTAAIQAEATARADADEALAESVTLVAAQAGNALAAVQTEATARASGDGALSTRIDAVIATAAGNTAAITGEATARANADSALGQRIDAVVADTADNAAAILAEQTARTNADGALANTLTSVSAQATRARTFRQATAPAAPQAGDLWYDTASNNAPKRWSGTGWESTEDPRIAATAAAVVAEQTARADGDSALASSISSVSAQASRSRTFRQSAAPTAPQTGDVWYDTANGNAAKRYSGTAWELVDDARLAANAAAITSESTARADADASLASQITTVSAQATRTRTFRQATAPGSPQTGDIWYDTSSNNAPKRYTGTAWESVEDPRTASNAAAIQAEATARADGDAALTTQVNTAISKADRVRTFRQASAPGAPQPGDVWFDTANNSAPKRWSGTAWESAEDPRIGLNTAAIASEATTRANADSALGQRIDTVIADVDTNAAAIQSEATARANADSALSNTLTTVSAQATRARTFRQSTAPVSPQAGDVWYDTSANNVAKRWSGTAWESTEDPRIGQNTAAITSEATARANADSALAGTLTTVQTTVGEHTATIQQQAQSIDGLSAQYTVKVDVNGYVSGFGLATTAKDGVPTSTFTVLAEKFEITAPGGSKISPFVVQNGTVYLRSVVIGTGWIGDTHIGPNGISASHLKADSVLTGSIRVGSSSGSTLSTVASNAADPAARINAGSTTLDPGKIVVKGTRTLTAVGGWFYEDTTEINGGSLRAGTVTAREVATGSLTVDRFAVFSTGNMLANSGFEDGWACWDRAGYAPGSAVRTFSLNHDPAWHLAGGVTLSVHQTNVATGGYWEGYYRHPASGWGWLPVQPGQDYEFSLYTGAHGCDVQIFFSWYNINGQPLGHTATIDTLSWNRQDALGGRTLAGYKRVWSKGKAPADAAFAEPTIRKYDSWAGRADSWAFFSLPFFGPCGPNATGPQPWQPGGVTKITGGQLAADDVIIRNSAQLGDTTVKTLHIGPNQVTVPITSGVVTYGYLPTHDVQICACFTIDSIGQPIRITASFMHVLDAWGDQMNGIPTAVFEIRRLKWNPSIQNWDSVTLVPNLGGSLTMRDASAASGVSRPWTYAVTDGNAGVGSFAYQLVGRRLVNVGIVSIVYATIEAMECRR